MNNEALVKEIADRAGFARHNTNYGTSRPVGVAIVPKELHWALSMAPGVTARRRYGAPAGFVRLEVLARLGQRTAARRFLRLMQRLARTADAFPGADLAYDARTGMFKVVNQVFTTKELADAALGQI